MHITIAITDYTRNRLFSYDSSNCKTTQKYKAELPVLWSKEINNPRPKVCPSLYITSVHAHHWHQTITPDKSFISSIVMFLVSHVHDHVWKSVVFSWVFRWQNDFHEGFSFRLWKSSIYSFTLWLIYTNVERLGREKPEKIVQTSSAILNLVTWPASV